MQWSVGGLGRMNPWWGLLLFSIPLLMMMMCGVSGQKAYNNVNDYTCAIKYC